MNSIWYPFTQMKTAPCPQKVISGQGAVLTLEDGRQVIDAISSWWVNLLGHARPEISRAIYEQAQKLEHVIFAGFTHEPAEKLAALLLRHLPPSLNKVFYSDNGSTAVEVALKMAYQYFVNKGEARDTFICFEGAYHGDTVGAMSLGCQSVFTRIFEKLLFKKSSLPYPATFEGDSTVQEREQEILSRARALLEQERPIAVLIEPLVQGVSGMQMCRPIFLQKLAALVKQSGALLIYDEVMTGFGRTGDWFACLKSQTEPDLICLAKGITGGFLPLAATVCTDEIYDAFYSDDPVCTFFHGHSYTANPLGCAAAIATLELLEKEPSCFTAMEKRHAPYVERLKELPFLQRVRVCGTIVAMDVKGQEGYFDHLTLRDYFLTKGVLIRPLGHVIYLMPPYCITDAQLRGIYESIFDLHDRFSANALSVVQTPFHLDRV